MLSYLFAFFDNLKIESVNTDLIIFGIPDVKADKQGEFNLQTNHLFETKSNKLPGRATNELNEIELHFSQEGRVISTKTNNLYPIPFS